MRVSRQASGRLLGLFVLDGGFDHLQSRLGLVKPCCQSIVSFLVLRLVERDVSVLVDGVLHQFGSFRHFVLQFVSLGFRGGRVESRPQRKVELIADGVLL